MRIVGPSAVLVATVERRDDLEPLDRLLLALSRERLLAVGRIDLLAQSDLFGVEVDAIDQLTDGGGAHATLEVLAPAILDLAPEHLVLDDLAGEEVLELVEGPVEHVDLELVALADRLHVLLGGSTPGVQVGGLGTLVFERLDLLLELLGPLGQLELALLLDGLALADDLGLDVGEIVVTLLLVDPGDEVGSEVDDLLELLGFELVLGLGARQEIGEPRPGAAQVPDVNGRGGQLDVAHPLAADLGPGDLDTAALTDDALEADALVLAARALPVLGGTEDLLAEEPVLLGLERAVVDGLRLLDLAVGPHTNGLGGGQSDAKLIKSIDVEHVSSLSCRPVQGRAMSGSGSARRETERA